MSTYRDSCPECGSTIIRDDETGEQKGRCRSCGHSEDDSDFRCDPFKELDFNDD